MQKEAIFMTFLSQIQLLSLTFPLVAFNIIYIYIFVLDIYFILNVFVTVPVHVVPNPVTVMVAVPRFLLFLYVTL